VAIVDKKRSINNVECEIHADVSGNWQVYEKRENEDDSLGRPIGRGDTLDKAVSAARIELNKRKVRVSVPFFNLKGERGVAHGFHARNRTILTDLGQFDTRTTVFTPDIPIGDLNKITELERKINEMSRQKRDLIGKYSMNLDNAVRDAIEAAVPKFDTGKTRKRL